MEKYIKSVYFTFNLKDVLFNSKDKNYTTFKSNKGSLSIYNTDIKWDDTNKIGTFRIKLVNNDNTPRTYEIYDETRKKRDEYSTEKLQEILISSGYSINDKNERKTLYL